MKLKQKALALALTALLSSAANAAFINLSWKVEGDNKATLDDQTGLEWLKLSETDNLSINSVKGLLDTTYAGWRLPTETEINQLLGNVLPTFPFVEGTQSYSSPSYRSSVDAWREVMGDGRVYNYSKRDFRNALRYYYHNYSYGLFEADDSSIKMTGTYRYRYYYQYNTTWAASIYNGLESANYLPDFANENYSVFLVSDGGATLRTSANLSTNDVPEPAGLALMASGLFGLAMLRRKKKQ